jgi:hypothetical protein
MAKLTEKPQKKSPENKVHPWRMCPEGQHWVRDHSRSTATHGVHGYCRHNRGGKDEIEAFEIDAIAYKYFEKLKGAPCAKALGFSQGSKFDSLIRGWTKYWNEVLNEADPIDPDLVKAIIATESGFRVRAVNKGNKIIGKALGLMQVTEQSWRILKDEHGELKDHFVVLEHNELFQANQNICAGVRWLYRKRQATSSKLGRRATWLETVANYKGYLKAFQKNPKHKKMGELVERYEKLKKC